MLTVRTVRIVWQLVDAPALDDPGIFPASYIERIAGTNINESLHQSASRAWLYEHASHARLERLVEECAPLNGMNIFFLCVHAALPFFSH